MKYDYHVLVIGLGPAGMAVSIMGAEMGLRVCAIERNKIGGECMNVGCIPSKALLRMAKMRYDAGRVSEMGLEGNGTPAVLNIFERIHDHISYINTNKTTAMFKKVNLILGEGSARFKDSHTVMVGDKTVTAAKIFICTGTKPAVPPIPGIETIAVLTNENVFDLPSIPRSLLVLGGGAIGCELAQAFARLGSIVTVVHKDDHLLPFGDRQSGELLQRVFSRENIRVYNGRTLVQAGMENGEAVLYTGHGERLAGERLMVAAGRKMDFDALNLAAAGVEWSKRGIHVNRYLQTSASHIYAPGDCNGHFLLSHAAMHQGMLALINSMLPAPFKRNFKKYVVPWTVFTDPQVSHVGATQTELTAQKKRFETVESRYEDYGAAIAEKVDIGYVSASISPTGRILGTRIVGEGSGEMINEWGLAIQKKMRITDILFLQHSFPTMSFLSKRVSENWMMNRMKSTMIKRMIRLIF
ncbi:FAD-dependent oxidoreductase [bacterium]|nr:FAD-dependent oxidoreductase [candidate division CSSED10-310 bacterium]